MRTAMLRSILVALDDTPGAEAARDLAIRLARETGAALSAAVILDDPHTQDEHEAVPPGGGAFKERRDAARARRAEAEAIATLAALKAAAGKLQVTELHLRDAPEPALLAASATHDLVVIGRDSTLGQEETEHGLTPVIEALLHDGARPLLVVPPGAATDDGPVVVGYDASTPARRSLQVFALLELAQGAPVKVVSAAATAAEAKAMAGEGAAFLRHHGLEVEAVAVTGSRPADLLLAEVAGLKARLLVMGAFETGALRSFLLGSATLRLLREAPCPVFVMG
jgi:nucleotide-binding universal stress UspA family protein